MITYRDLVVALGDLGLDGTSRVIAHADLAGMPGWVGGAESVVGALRSTVEVLLMPAFTYRTMVVPPVGPPNNGLTYEGHEEANREAEIFHLDLPVDEALGPVPEVLRRMEGTRRSTHPILSFCVSGAPEALERQSLDEPLAPIAWLAEYDGDVLLLGTDQRRNVSLHWAEALAGRNRFVRWAPTTRGVMECRNMPGCSEGFGAIWERLEGVATTLTLGNARLERVPLRDLLNIASAWIREDPEALLCLRKSCQRCAAVRADLRDKV